MTRRASSEFEFELNFVIFVSQVDQYADFKIPFNGLLYEYTNKTYIPGENIADNGGMKVFLHTLIQFYP